jgi:hypothetical protein
MSASVGSGELRPVGVFLAAIATAIMVTACEQSEARRGGAETDPPSPVAARSVESEQHGYRVEVPADWEFAEGTGTWTSLDQLVPGAEVPGEDLAAPTAGSGSLVANSMPLPQGMTAAQWLAELDELVGTGPSPDCREQRSADVVAGEQATVVRHRCDDLTIVGNGLVHANRGYYFTVGYATGDEATESTLEQIASSIRFTG